MTERGSQNGRAVMRWFVGMVGTIVAGLVLWGYTSRADSVDDLEHTTTAHEERIKTLETHQRDVVAALLRIEEKIDGLTREVVTNEARLRQRSTR